MTFLTPLKTLLFFLLTFLFCDAQNPEPLEIVKSSTVLTPSAISDKYGVLFVLPFTGSPSEKFMRVYFNDWNPWPNWQLNYEAFLNSLAIKKPLILVMVSGKTSTQDHDARGFASAIARFDEQVKKDLASLEKKYSIDRRNLYLTGFSLGGDLSWAISQKNPGMFKGAVIAGSRCGFRNKGSFEIWKKNNFRVYIAAGQNESSVIKQGIEQTKSDLQHAGIDRLFLEIPDVGHKMIPQNQFLESLRFIMSQNQ